jgi:3-oxoacyl-[acyl-carrier-protein] synthase II
MNPLTSARPQAPAAITGVGMVTGYGWGKDSFWDGLHSGVSAVVDDTEAAEALGEDHFFISRVPDPDPTSPISRFSRALLSAADEAIADARERGWEPGPSVGVIHCAVLGDIREMHDFYLQDNGRRRARTYLKLMPSTPLSMLMQKHGFHGPAMSVGAMCASGNAGILTAMAWLDAGLASDVIVAATDLSADAEHVRQFVELGVLKADAPALDVCRPFQEGSRGFPGGEAATAFVLTRRDGQAYASVLGGFMTHDAFHVTNVDPGLEQIRHVVQGALDAAGVDGSDVAYLNAHGPGTAQCDAAEAAVSADLLPNAELYSLKPLVGHCQGAASLVEMAGACLAYERGVIPAPAQVADGDPRLLDGPTPTKPGITVKTSIGLGGHNSAVVLAPER